MRRVARLGTLAAVVGLVCLGLPSMASAQAGEGVITGKVTDHLGNPIGPESGICALPGGYSSGWSNLEADGTYRIENVPAGKYAVIFSQCGTNQNPNRQFAPEFYPNLHDPAAVNHPSPLPNVTVVGGQTTSGIDAQLEPGAALTARVLDGSSTPRQGLCVTAEPKLAAGSIPIGSLPQTFTGVTGVDGRVRFTGMPMGNYTVKSAACDWAAPSHPDLTRVQFAGGAFTMDAASTTQLATSGSASVDVVMAAGATLSGQVRWGGSPRADACVTWGDRNGTLEVRTTTDANGNYQLRGLVPTLPGILRACGGPSPQSVYEPGEPKQEFFPEAASRWTAGELVLAPGSTRSQDFDLELGYSLSVIVTGLPSSNGCEAIATNGILVRRTQLRATPTPNVFVGDIFGLTSNSSSDIHLECGGRRAGTGRLPTWSTPYFQEGWTENQGSPVVALAYDATGPVITPSPNPATMPWSPTPVTISFSCSDPAGVASCPAPVTYGEGQATWVSATDGDGNVSSLAVVPRVDSTPPVIQVTGNGRTFRRDELMQFACDAWDDRSGLARVSGDTCPAWGTPASDLGVGTHTFQLGAVDWAGNVSVVAATLTIVK